MSIALPGVHQEHCCASHGCKYGEDDCPVYTGELRQSYPCEQCDEELIDKFFEREFPSALFRVRVKDGCPCLFTEPCQKGCTCVQPFSSSGCRRCCKYGSEEQRRAKAEQLAKMIDNE